MSRRTTAGIVGMTAAIIASGYGVAEATTAHPAAKPAVAAVKACRTGSGYLALPSAHHRCSRGTSKVALAVKGSATNGVKVGPGGLTLSFASDQATTGSSLTLNGWTYHFACGTSGGVWTTTFAITNPQGTIYNLYSATQDDHNESGTLTASDGHSLGIAGEFDATLGAAATNSFRNFEEFYLNGSDGSVQHVSLVWSADADTTLPAGESRCMGTGQVVATS